MKAQNVDESTVFCKLRKYF